MLKRPGGKEGIANCRKDLGLENTKLKDGMQYPNEMLIPIIKWISDGKGIEYVRKAGNHAVKNLGMLAYVVRFAKMETMIEKAEEAYYESYSTGKVDMKIGDHKAIAIMKNVSEIPENCEGWLGAIEALLEITHTRGNVLKTKCQLKGEDHCEYEITWE